MGNLLPMPVASPDKRGGYSYDRPSKPVVENNFAHETHRSASEPGQTKDTLKIRCATLNVATYTGKEEEIVYMMQRRRIDFLGMAETRHFGRSEGKDLGRGFVLTYSGVKQGRRKHRVAIIANTGSTHTEGDACE